MTNPPVRKGAWGVGFSYRFCVHEEVMRCAGMFDFIEIPTDDYAIASRRANSDPDESMVQAAAARFPSVAHGTLLSIGTAAPPDQVHLEEVAAFVARTPISEYSEHLSFTRGGKDTIPGFISIPFTDLGVAAAAENIRHISDRIGLPLIVENVSYHFAIPGATMTEPEFLRRVCETSDCGLLIDITNIQINAINNGYDPHQFIRDLPGDRVMHAHFCGVTEDHDGYLFDTHREPTTKEIWQLLEETLNHTDLRTVVLERDEKFSPFKEILDEMWRAKEIFLKYRPGKAPATFSPPRYAPNPDAKPSNSHSPDLALFQDVLVSVLLDEQLGKAVAKEGESALKHTGLGADERKLIAQIPEPRRELLGRHARHVKAQKAKRLSTEH
jgi:uncharacterized protein (UPF0276 family)